MELFRPIIVFVVVVEVVLFLSICLMASSTVVLINKNFTMSFGDVEANFAPAVESSGECGVLYVAEPLDACTNLTNKVEKVSNYSSPFVLIIRGGCSFCDKVSRAQEAGFKAAIVYDNEDDILVASLLRTNETKSSLAVLELQHHGTSVDIDPRVAGNSTGINISAVFVAKSSGEILMQYAGLSDVELWIIPSFENSVWSIMAISFFSVLAMSAVLATCFFVQRRRIRRDRHHHSRVREFHGMSRRLVKALPSLIFTADLEDNCTSRTCAICLEDYSIGERLRILPCQHKFHAICVDSWLTTWRTFCPVCKRDARTSPGDPPASESTPLLSSSPASISSSSLLSSIRSATSSAMQVLPMSSHSPSMSHAPSTSDTPNIDQSLFSHHQLLSLRVSHSSADLRNMSSHRTRTSHLDSLLSFGYPSVLPLNAYAPSPRNTSSGLVTSGNQSRLLHGSTSATSLFPYASAHCLPEC